MTGGNMIKACSLPLAVLALVGCVDGSRATDPTALAPTPPSPLVTGMRATVDVTAGTLTFESPPNVRASTGDASDLRPAGIYGDQGVTVRLYNSPVTVASSATPGKETYTADVGLRNLLAFSIGDEQAGASPLDTMGIYVFVTSGPTVTASSSPCSPSCTVITQNHHGTLAFTGMGQRYWHWSERVGEFGGGADTTRVRRTWVFEADTQVTAFRFDVLVSAAWPPPNDTRWKIDYQGDSLPHTQTEPQWHLTDSLGGTYVVTNGVLNITTNPPDDIEFYRRDSVTTAANAYAEARIRFNSTSGGSRAAMHFNDGVKYVALGIRSGEVGFISSSHSGPLIAGWATTTDTLRTYQLRKYAADSAVIYVDGARVGAIAYAGLSTDPTAASDTRFAFGCPRTGVRSSADWDYVIYEIGVTQP